MTITPDELAEKLILLKLHDPGLELFGASTHGYKLNSSLSREELAQFEGSAGIDLPEEFQDFLLNFGNGGAGPGYGLLSLQESVGEFGSDPINKIARPFIPPHSASEQLEDRDYPDDGLLPLAHMGCGHMWMLAITGPERGTVWNYLSGGDYQPCHLELPFYPPSATLQQRLDANNRLTDALLSDPSRRMHFWDWYLDWVGRSAQMQPGSWRFP
jgi:hypothetical protein